MTAHNPVCAIHQGDALASECPRVTRVSSSRLVGPMSPSIKAAAPPLPVRNTVAAASVTEISASVPVFRKTENGNGSGNGLGNGNGNGNWLASQLGDKLTPHLRR